MVLYHDINYFQEKFKGTIWAHLRKPQVQEVTRFINSSHKISIQVLYLHDCFHRFYGNFRIMCWTWMRKWCWYLGSALMTRTRLGTKQWELVQGHLKTNSCCPTHLCSQPHFRLTVFQYKTVLVVWARTCLGPPAYKTDVKRYHNYGKPLFRNTDLSLFWFLIGIHDLGPSDLLNKRWDNHTVSVSWMW